MQVFNITLLLLFITLVINFKTTNPFLILSCGIFAWTGTSVDEFKPALFNYLGKENDRRGGDSCGVYFNKTGIFGIGTTAKYEELTKSNKLHSIIKPIKNPVVIGHTRNASVGAVTLINAQPTMIRDGAKNDKLVYVQAHNGNISGYRDLAKKYEVAVVEGESDSVAMAKVVAKEGLKILKEFEGSAALVLYFVNEPNVLYIFRNGWSLYYSIFQNSGVYIASESSPLEWISNGVKPVEFEMNTLYKVEGDTVTLVEKIERETVVKKITTPVSYENTGMGYHYGYNHDFNDRYENDLPFWRSTYHKDKNLQMGVTKNIYTSKIGSSVITDAKTAIRYMGGFFILNKEFAHGKYITDNWGYTKEKMPVEANPSFKLFHLYFFHGILLYDAKAFEVVMKEAKELKFNSPADFKDNNKFAKLTPTLREYAIYPFTRINDKAATGYMEATDLMLSSDVAESFYTGSFTPIFSDNELIFKEGDFDSYKIRGRMQLVTDLIFEEVFLKEYQFGSENPTFESASDVVEINSCAECKRIGLDFNSVNCEGCKIKLKLDTTKGLGENVTLTSETFTEDSDNRVILLKIIDVQATSVMDSLSSLIDEVNSSDYGDLVKDKLNILNNAEEILTKLWK